MLKYALKSGQVHVRWNSQQNMKSEVLRFSQGNDMSFYHNQAGIPESIERCPNHNPDTTSTSKD